MRNILSSVYFSTGILHACSAIPIPYKYTGQHDVVLIGMLACLGLGSFIMGVCIFCKKKSGKFKKFKDGDIIQEVISTEYPILKALNVLDSSVPCAVIPSSPNNLSTDNLLDKIETYQIDVDHRHDSYCTRRSDPLTCTYDEFDPNDESDDRTERTATTATVEPPISEEPLLFSDVFDESMERSEKCALSTIPMQLPTSSGEEDDEVLVAPRSDAEDEDERRPLVSDESIDEAAATTATTITVTATMAQSADAISIEEALRALDIAIEGEEDEEDDDEEEGQATPLNVDTDGSSGSPSIYSEPPADNALTREDVEQQAAELVDDVLYKCQYMLQMMDANGSNLSPLEAEEFSPTNSRGNIFDGWGNYELDENGTFAAVGEENDNDDWWKGSLEPFDDEEGSWNRAGNDPFENDQAYDLLRQQLSQLLPQANDCAGGAIGINNDDQAQGSPKLSDNGGLSGFERADRETEENEIIINYNRSLSPIMEENEDEYSLPPSISVAHCSNFVESTIISTEGPVVCEATESVPALAKRSSLTASNDTLFNLEDVLEDRCMTPQESDTFPAGNSASPRTLSESNNQGLEKLYTTFSASRLMPLASVAVTSATPPLPPPPASIVSPLGIGVSMDDHFLHHHHHQKHHQQQPHQQQHHVLLSSLCLEDLRTGDIMECPSPSPPPLPAAIVGLNGGAGGSGAGTNSGLLMGETMQDLPSSA
ncbi:uncharacterized protein LOC131285398 [Anopheles ziemanni]|uniref:uncharacterized protein LOC131266038 n=1 Tax=Anopheles coustani TaxID=139045 RepID=UPI002659C150|nr:uncharacterized protein LOC131266038 [Anopheles coustani]XP_058170236.1 uncharacterized protein LOC131285398 [Anopheles ziemanni]